LCAGHPGPGRPREHTVCLGPRPTGPPHAARSAARTRQQSNSSHRAADGSQDPARISPNLIPGPDTRTRGGSGVELNTTPRGRAGRTAEAPETRPPQRSRASFIPAAGTPPSPARPLAAGRPGAAATPRPHTPTLSRPQYSHIIHKLTTSSVDALSLLSLRVHLGAREMRGPRTETPAATPPPHLGLFIFAACAVTWTASA